MKSLIIAWKDFSIRLKDRRGFMLMILMPLLLTAILGSALSGVMSDSSSTFPKTTIGLVMPDGDALADRFVTDVLLSNDLKPYLKVDKSTDEASIKEKLKAGKVDVAIVFPKKWSENLNEGKLKSLTILRDPGKTIQSDIVTSIAQTYVGRVQAVAVATKVVMTKAIKVNPSSATEVSKQVGDQLSAVATETLSAVKDQAVGKKPITGMQYYAAAMAAMFLLFNMTNGAKSFLIERDTQTLARLLSTPVTKLSVLIGKFLGTLYFASAQFLIFMLATKFIFKVNWGSNMLQTLVVGLSFAIAVSGLSMLIASLIKTEKSADIFAGMGIQVFAILGGSMVPMSLFPALLQKLAHIAPNTWALSSFIKIMGGTAWMTLMLPISVLVVIGLLSTIIGTWRLQVR